MERYEEQVLSTNRGNLRIRVRFPDQALLETSEALFISGDKLQWLSYRYHYQDASGAQVFRYDNAPHHSEVATHPDHKHTENSMLPSPHPSIEEILEEVRAVRTKF